MELENLFKIEWNWNNSDCIGKCFLFAYLENPSKLCWWSLFAYLMLIAKVRNWNWNFVFTVLTLKFPNKNILFLISYLWLRPACVFIFGKSSHIHCFLSNQCKKIHQHNLIKTFTFIKFWEKLPLTRLFGPHAYQEPQW